MDDIKRVSALDMRTHETTCRQPHSASSPNMATPRKQNGVEKHIDRNSNNSRTDLENLNNRDANNSLRPAAVMDGPPSYHPTSRPFIGRLGGNQEFVLDRHNTANAEVLREQPDSAPCMTLKEQFDLRGFRNIGLWKAALIEGIGEHLPSTLCHSIKKLT